jgi:phosphohistidine phosphatase
MDIYLIRHAEALALGERGITEDADRRLSEQGEMQAQEVGLGLRRLGVKLDKIVTSPLLRAKQTTDAVLRGWPAPLPEVHVCPYLAPDAKPKKLARYLSNLGGNTVALVGHQPHLGIWIGWLIGSRKAQIDLAKAGVARVECDEPRKGDGTLIWLLTPDWLVRGAS